MPVTGAFSGLAAKSPADTALPPAWTVPVRVAARVPRPSGVPVGTAPAGAPGTTGVSAGRPFSSVHGPPLWAGGTTGAGDAGGAGISIAGGAAGGGGGGGGALSPVTVRLEVPTA